ncbi:sensor histidine kinase [Kutzneria buriramensis]|nr:sensor histidine kinase [Kutzneria buriramensis]
MLIQARRDFVYLITGLPIALASFAVLAVGVSLGAGTLVIWIGIPLLAAVLGAAQWFAELARRRARAVTGADLPPTSYLQPTGSTFARSVAVLRDPQAWRDVLYGVVSLPLTMFTWIVSLMWTVLAVFGPLYPLYGWVSGPSAGSVNDLLGWHGYVGTAVTNFLLGLVFLATVRPVLRRLVQVQVSLARALLSDEKAALRARTEQLTASRSAAVQAEAQTLRRVERDIHDGPQQRLVRLTMDLEAVRRRLDDNPEAARGLVDEALTQSREALSELRAVSRGIAPPILTDRGLGPALAAAAARCPVDTVVECELPEDVRLPEAVENAAYFVVSEALTNVAKHSRAGKCAVRVTLETDTLWLRVTDDGVGGAHLGKGHGLAGLVDRLAAVDGQLDVHSPAGGPTVLTAEIPVDQ